MKTFLEPMAIVNGPPAAPLKKVGRNDGRVVQPLGLSLTWKVTGIDTNYYFAVYEMTIAPGAGIPMHVHPFAEYFYVVEGEVEVMHLNRDGTVASIQVGASESAVAPVNAAHGLRNVSSSLARFLSVASFAHEEAFNRIEREFAGRPPSSETERVDAFLQLASDMQVYFLRPDENDA